MGRYFAVALVLIAVACAAPVAMHWWPMPPDISKNGYLIDRQMSSIMLEAGGAFLLSQFLLAYFIFRSSDRTNVGAIRSIPGGIKALTAVTLLLVGAEIVALGIQGRRAWGAQYNVDPGPNAMTIQAQAGQFAYSFRYPGPDGKLGPQHPDKIDEASQNLFGLDPENDADSRDDIVTGELGVPANREIRLLLHSKDVGHSFYVPALRVQQDFVPGLDLMIHFNATRIGRYEIVCTQLCGMGHSRMKAYLNVMTQEDFDKWLARKAQEQP